MAAVLLGCGLSGVLAVLLVAVSYTTTWWLVPAGVGGSPQIRVGLWKACLDNPTDDTSCVSVFSEHSMIATTLGDWFYAVQFMTTLGIILTGLVLFCFLLNIIEARINILRTGVVLTLFAGVAYFLGLVIFSIETSKHHLRDTSLSGLTLGSSFYCGVGAGVSGILSGALTHIHVRQKQMQKWKYVRLN